MWAQFNQAFDDESSETAQILAALQRDGPLSIEHTIRAAQGSLRLAFLTETSKPALTTRKRFGRFLATTWIQ